MLLVDGKAQLYRLLGGMRPNSRAEQQEQQQAAALDADPAVVGSLVEGFLFLLRNLLRLQPATTHLAVAFDAQGLTFRHTRFPGYKAGRPPAAPEMEPAITALEALLPLLAVPVLRVPGVEAEDVAATIAKRATDAGFTDVVIMSPDKDLYQLLGPHVRLLRGLKAPSFPRGAPPPTPTERAAALQAGAAWYTAEDFRAEHPGLEPPQWVEVMALAGSASDNLPGLPGVGHKTAEQLVAEWGSLEALLPHASEIKRKKVAELLASVEGSEAARFTRELVTIVDDLQVPAARQPPDNFWLRSVPPQDQEAALQLASSLGVQALVVRDIIAYPHRSTAPPEHHQPPLAAPFPEAHGPPAASMPTQPQQHPIWPQPPPSTFQQQSQQATPSPPLGARQPPPSAPGNRQWALLPAQAAAAPPPQLPSPPAATASAGRRRAPPPAQGPWQPPPAGAPAAGHHPSHQQHYDQAPAPRRRAPSIPTVPLPPPVVMPELTSELTLEQQEQLWAVRRQQLAASSWRPLKPLPSAQPSATSTATLHHPEPPTHPPPPHDPRGRHDPAAPPARPHSHYSPAPATHPAPPQDPHGRPDPAAAPAAPAAPAAQPHSHPPAPAAHPAGSTVPTRSVPRGPASLHPSPQQPFVSPSRQAFGSRPQQPFTSTPPQPYASPPQQPFPSPPQQPFARPPQQPNATPNRA